MLTMFNTNLRLLFQPNLEKPGKKMGGGVPKANSNAHDWLRSSDENLVSSQAGAREKKEAGA